MIIINVIFSCHLFIFRVNLFTNTNTNTNKNTNKCY